MKFLIIFCLGVLAVQAQDPIDELVRELEDLNREATTESQRAIETLGEELRSFDELGAQFLRYTGETLNEDARHVEERIHELEEEARQYRVDISECTGVATDAINGLPLRLLGETGECVNERHGQAERAINEGVERINEAVGHIDEYWREVERCREADRREQEECVAELNDRIRNDQEQIPVRIHLAVEEVLVHVDNEKSAILLCSAGTSEIIDEEGGHIVQRATECAQRLFPPGPNP